MAFCHSRAGPHIVVVSPARSPTATLLSSFWRVHVRLSLERFAVPVFFAIPLAGVVTAAVGLIFGLPAAA